MLRIKKVVVIGASGFGRESLDVLEAMRENGANIDVLGVVDDAPSQANSKRLKDRGIPYLGNIEEWIKTDTSDINYVLGIGNPAVRRRLTKRLEGLGIQPLTIIHPTAIVGSRFTIGSGAIICAGAVISTNVRLGKHVHINPNATIGHDSELKDFVSVNPGAVVSGDVVVEEETLLGANSTVLQGIRVGARTVVGATSCVTKDLPSDVVAKGVPARVSMA